MRAFVNEDCVLHIVPESGAESVALKYWLKEFAAHGAKMLEVAESVAAGRELLREQE